MEKRNGLVEFPGLGHEQESSPVDLLFNNNRGNISAGALVKSRYKFLIYHGWFLSVWCLANISHFFQLFPPVKCDNSSIYCLCLVQFWPLVNQNVRKRSKASGDPINGKYPEIIVELLLPVIPVHLVFGLFRPRIPWCCIPNVILSCTPIHHCEHLPATKCEAT